jgi:hypothetical protein
MATPVAGRRTHENLSRNDATPLLNDRAGREKPTKINAKLD